MKCWAAVAPALFTVLDAQYDVFSADNGNNCFATFYKTNLN